MPLFDLTTGVKAQHSSGAQPQESYDVMKRIVVTFAKRGYAISWTEQKPPSRLVANLTDKEGTDLTAEINVVDEGTVTRSDIYIHGSVFLGGILGRLVSANTIQSKAQEKIKELLDQEFAGMPSKRAAAGKPKPPVSTLPPKPSAPPVEAAPSKPALHPVLADKLAQVQEAFDAGLLSETEAGDLRTRLGG